MGRGRAKAKQQKVARELKYNTHFTDLDALQRELGTSGSGDHQVLDGDDAGDDDLADDLDADIDEWTGTDR